MSQVIQMEEFLVSDFFGYILIALLVIVAVIFVYVLISNVIQHIRVSRFFALCRPSVGTVLGYKKIDENTHITMQPIFMGKSMNFTPRIRYTPGQYYISLECQCRGKHFQASYQISAEEYEQEKVGTPVRIKDDWMPVGYELL